MGWWRRERSAAGVLPSLHKLARLGWEFVRDSMPDRRRRRYGDVDYDWENRVNTTSAVVSGRTRLLGMLNSPYQPIEPDLFREMMKALPIEFARFTFVDIGSGKGRALLLAADYGFKRIVGVELLPELNEVARENVRRILDGRPGSAAIEIISQDAVEFALPEEPLVVFLFNPLPEAGLRKFVARLEASVRANPRAGYVVYANPVLESILEDSSLVEKVAATHQFSMFCFRAHGIDESRKA